MTDPKLNLNPFVLPGMGQTGEAASNPLFASMEMLRQAMSGLAQVGGAMGISPSLAPTIHPEELERRIQELKVVENWLKLNLSMLSSTIQGMEVQLATISTIRAFVGADTPFQTAAPPKADPSPKAEPSPKADSSPRPDPSAMATPSAEPVTQAMPAAAKAWWDMLETQFKQVAAATAATLSPKTDSKAASRGKQPVKQLAGAAEVNTVRKTTGKKTSSTNAVSQKSSHRRSSGE